jgi:hypothetical protein
VVSLKLKLALVGLVGVDVMAGAGGVVVLTVQVKPAVLVARFLKLSEL